MTIKEKLQNAKAIKEEKKENKKAAKEKEVAEFNDLPLKDKEEIRNDRAARTALWVITGIAATTIVVSGVAAIYQAKKSKDAMGSVISDAEIDAISAKY